jgi:hypothetical protein
MWWHYSPTYQRGTWRAARSALPWMEQLDDKTWLVEFSDDDGRAYAFAPCGADDLLVLHYVSKAA